MRRQQRVQVRVQEPVRVRVWAQQQLGPAPTAELLQLPRSLTARVPPQRLDRLHMTGVDVSGEAGGCGSGKKQQARTALIGCTHLLVVDVIPLRVAPAVMVVLRPRL